MSGTDAESSSASPKYHLVWLDTNIENKSNQKTLSKYAELDETIQGFDNPEACVSYLRDYQKMGNQRPILFIVSGLMSESAIPRIHHYPWVVGIFIYCRNPRRLDHLKFAKLRDICDDPAVLMDQLRDYNDEDNASLDYIFFTDQTSTDEHPMRTIKEDQARFLWFYKCHQFMVDLDDESPEEAKAEMVAFCREKFRKDSEIKVIDRFEAESAENNALNGISWYTHSHFMFRQINQVLNQGNITRIYRFRYIIRLLCQHLKRLNGNCRHLSDTSRLVLYRGLALKSSQILEMSRHIGDLISVNSFLSTSTDRDVAIDFSRRHVTDGFESVLLIINVDMDHCQHIVMADILELSKFKEEKEVLVSIGSIFTIQSVVCDEEKKLFTVQMALSDVAQLTVNKYLEETYQNDAALSDRAILFGKLLFDMGEYPLAIEYLQKRLANLPKDDPHKRPIFLNNIGVCYNEMGDKQRAIKHYQLAMRIYEENPDRDGDPDYYQNELGGCYHNIASYYFGIGDHSNAYRMAMEALDKRQHFPLGAASTYDLLGCIQMAKRDEEAAYESLRRALQLRIKYLSSNNPNHPDIGISYENMARLCVRRVLYIDAAQNYQRAAEIYRHNYPQTHQRVVFVERRLNELSKVING